MIKSNSILSQKDINVVGVIGGTGYLGYKIVKELLEKDFSVKIGISNNKKVSDEHLIKNLIENYGDENISVSQLSSFKQQDFEDYLENVDAIIIAAKNHQK